VIAESESAASVLQAAMVARLAGALPVTVFDAPPVRAGDPYAVVDEPVLADWSTKTWAGREGRASVQLFDRGERPVRLRALAGAAEAALEGWQPELGGGWRLVSVRLARSRVLRERDGRWRGVSEFAVRMWRED
jgi:hypothetical protein